MSHLPSPSSPPEEPAAHAAAEWVLRLDRGLSAAEQDAYTQWLAADPRHREAMAEWRWGWDELDRLAGIQDSVHAVPDPDLLAPPPAQPRPGAGMRRFWPQFAALAAAAALAVIYWRPREGAEENAPPAPAPSYALAAPIEERTLDDGSLVSLNRGAVVETAFTAGERRVRLLRGEANFVVAKNAVRPFIVHAGGVDVRAIGTVFNVRLGHAAVEVVVSAGKVGLERPAGSVGAPTDPAAGAPTFLVANQRAVVPLATRDGATVSTLDAAELDRRLAWQPRLLDFTDQPLPEIVAEFNRRNSVRLIVADPALEQVRLSAAFRSDNLEGFVRLMESDFEMRAEWRGEMEIALRRK